MVRFLPSMCFVYIVKWSWSISPHLYSFNSDKFQFVFIFFPEIWIMDLNKTDEEAPKDPGALKTVTSITDNEISGKNFIFFECWKLNHFSGSKSWYKEKLDFSHFKCSSISLSGWQFAIHFFGIFVNWDVKIYFFIFHIRKWNFLSFQTCLEWQKNESCKTANVKNAIILTLLKV